MPDGPEVCRARSSVRREHRLSKPGVPRSSRGGRDLIPRRAKLSIACLSMPRRAKLSIACLSMPSPRSSGRPNRERRGRARQALDHMLVNAEARQALDRMLVNAESPQMSRTHSCAHAGAYPDLPVFRLSKRRGYTSSRPRKSERNSATLSRGDDDWLTRGALGFMGATRDLRGGCPSLCHPLEYDRTTDVRVPSLRRRV